MAFTKIKNEAAVQITLPSGIGGAAVGANSVIVVPFDVQTVAAAMATAGIIAYSMESFSSVNTVIQSVSQMNAAGQYARYFVAVRPTGNCDRVRSVLW